MFLVCISKLVQGGSGTNDEFGKNAEDLIQPTKDASEANTSYIVPEQARIMTAFDYSIIQSIDVGPDDNLASRPNESLKNADSAVSLEVQHTAFGRCIGRLYQIRSIHN